MGVRTSAAEDQAGAADPATAGTEAELDECTCEAIHESAATPADHAHIEATAQAEQAADLTAGAGADAAADASRKKAAAKSAKKQRQKAKKQQAQPEQQQMHQAQMQQFSRAAQEQSAPLQDITSAINTAFGPHPRPEPGPSERRPPAPAAIPNPAERCLPATLPNLETDTPPGPPKLPDAEEQNKEISLVLPDQQLQMPWRPETPEAACHPTHSGQMQQPNNPEPTLHALKEGGGQPHNQAEASDPNRRCHQLLHSFDTTEMPVPNGPGSITKTEGTSKMLHQPQLLRCPITQVLCTHTATLLLHCCNCPCRAQTQVVL